MTPVFKDKLFYVLIAVLAASVALKVSFAFDYVTYTDELLSTFAAESISETGKPTLSSGGLYTRAPLAHYLLSIPIGLFGVDLLPIRIGSIFYSLVTALLIYILGRRIMRPGLAFVGAAMFSFCSLGNQFALSGRMYMAYAMFFMLTACFFQFGYIEDRKWAKTLTLLAMVATMLSSEAGLLLGFILFVGLLVHRGPKVFRERTTYVGLGLWVVGVWFVMGFLADLSLTTFTVHGGTQPAKIIHLGMGFREILSDQSYLWRTLDSTLPFSLCFFIPMVALVILKRDLRQHYPLVILLAALLAESLLTYRIQYRIVIALVPLYYVVCFKLIDTAWSWRSVKQPSQLPRWSLLLAGSLSVLSLASVLFFAKIRGPSDVAGYLKQAYGFHDARQDQDPRPSYTFLASQLEEGDIVVASTLEYALFYLGKEHDFRHLRQKRLDGGFGSFGERNDPYYGKPIVDDVSVLKETIESADGTVWIVAGPKADGNVGQPLKEFITDQFEIAFDDSASNSTLVYRLSANGTKEDPRSP